MGKKSLILLLALLMGASAAFAQSITVKGKIVDANTGEGIPFASVIQQNTRNGQSSDGDGNYSITVPMNAVLVFSSLGYNDLVVPVDGKALHDVRLEPNAETLEQTIVVAFGTATKESFTGSAAVVDDKKLAKSQVSNVTDALAGAVAGVQLVSSNGAPGAKSTIRVRGFSSISAGQDPLIIVDGAPFGGDLATINQADIESMTVLKDAASNALYGARGANGVIMITTKSAKKGEATFTFEGKVGVNSRALRNYTTVRNPAQYYELHYKALENYYINKVGLTQEEANRRINANISGDSASGGLGYDIWTLPAGMNLFDINGKLNPLATLGKTINYKGEDYLVTPDNWEDYGYRDGIRQEYNFSVTGSTDRSSFFASIGYLDNQGITEKSDMSRLSARLKADYQAKKWLKVGGNFTFANYKYNQLSNNGTDGSTANVWAFTSRMAPIYPIYIRNADGTPKKDSNGFDIMDYGDGLNAGFARPFISDANPIMDKKLNTNETEGNNFTINGFADFQLFRGMKLTINGTFYDDEYRQTYVYNPYYGQFDSTGGTVEKVHSRYQTFNLQQLLNYNNSFGLHNVGLMLGHEYYDARTYELWASKSKMFSQDNKELSGAVVDGQSSGSDISEYNNEGYFARFQYDYATKYFLSASVRRDASSRFHPDYRWGTFWSLGAAYIMSKENWFNVPAINELKLKASFGSQGNDNIGSYRYTDLFDIINSDGNVATQFSTKGSKNITWETNTNFNAGIEFGLFNKVTGSFEYFNRLTTDMLFSFPVAPSMGYSSYYANVGDMRNYGLELELGVNLVNNKNFKWDISGNITYLKNKIIKLDDDKKTDKYYDKDGNEYQGYRSGSFIIAEGVSLYTWSLKEFAGVDQETGESLFYKDVVDDKGDRTGERETTTNWSDANAKYYVTNQSTIAPFYGGFGTNLELYGFDFSINFTYQIGGKQYDSSYADFMSSPISSTGYNYHVDLYKSWTKDNKNNEIPRFQFGDNYSTAASTRFLTDASYLNIQNINFGYTLPQKFTQKFDVQALRIFFSAENVYYFSKREGFDPRQTYSGSTTATRYAPMRTISGGLSVRF